MSTITATFNGGRNAETASLYQWDYGVTLVIEGIELPAAYEAHFANDPGYGEVITMIGGAEGVQIPNVLLQSGRPVYCWIYLTTATSGRTKYQITIPVIVRPQTEDDTPTPEQQSAIDQAIAALDDAVEQTGRDAASAAESARNAGISEENALGSERNAAASEQAAHDSEVNAAGSARSASESEIAAAASEGNAAASERNAALSESAASGYAIDAAASARAASTSEGNAFDSARSASGSAEAASGSAASAGTNALKAEGFAVGEQGGEAVGSGSPYYHNNAEYYSDQAGSSATSASGSATSAETNALKAEGYAVGKQNGTDVGDTSPYYHNNAEYYATEAAASARDAAESAASAAQSASVFVIDPTLTHSGQAADAKVTGDELASVKSDLNDKASVIISSTSGSIAHFEDGSESDAVDVIAYINPVQSGSGDPSPTNVRPITGFTGMNITGTGANIWDEETELGGISSSDGSEYSASNAIRAKNYIPVIAGKQYYFLCPVNVTRCFYDENKQWISTGYSGNIVLTVPSNACYFRFSLPSTYGTTYNHDISINYPSTDHDYHAYNPDSDIYPITFPTEAGTVYGGYVDPVKGKLVVDRASVDLGTLTWDYNSSDKRIYSRINGWKEYTVSQVANAICSQYYSVSRNDLSSFDKCFSISTNVTSFINIRDTAYSDATTFIAAMDGVQLVYELATPITYDITPTQIALLLGVNNVWNDCNGDTSVTYKSDTKLYIEQLTKPTEDDMVANTAIASGKFFMIGNRLFISTSTIASGDTINPGTNCTELSLADALNSL